MEAINNGLALGANAIMGAKAAEAPKDMAEIRFSITKGLACGPL
jgi:hypothetical protein